MSHQLTFEGTSELSHTPSRKMESRMADPVDRVEEWLNHASEVGTASMLPERAFPDLIVGYTVWRGKP